MKLTVHSGGETREILCRERATLLDILRSEGLDITAVCGGGGRCGKCRVRVISPRLEPHRIERNILTPAELDGGIRLACLHILECDTEVSLDTRVTKVLTADADGEVSGAVSAAVDIGTTTVAAALVSDGKIIAAAGEKNAQSPFGADVMERIRFSSEGDGGRLRMRELIATQLDSMLTRLCDENGVGISDITVSANTTMLHLLFGEDCSAMGVSPYTPAFLESRKVKLLDIGMKLNAEITSLPCISAFAGADTVAGILTNPVKGNDFTLLVDLGTNAEIALYNAEECLVTSAAAGPAFEGANIRCGSGAVSGAVCSFAIENDGIHIGTVDGASPESICGSGLIDIAASLVREGLITGSGVLKDGEYRIFGGVSLYAQDVRELQLAKAAIAAGIECLLDRAGIGTDRVDRLILSGGFGQYINIENAALLGLIPKELVPKAFAAGNTSLAGAAMCAGNPDALERAKKIARKARYIDLSRGEDFLDRYVDNMNF